MSDELNFGAEEETEDAGQKLGRDVLGKVALAMKLSTMHNLANKAMEPPMQALMDIVNAEVDAGTELCLQAIGENFFLNREIIKLDFRSFESGQMLRSLLSRVGIQEVAFKGQLSHDELTKFLDAFQSHWRSQEPKKFRTLKFPNIAIRVIENIQAGEVGAEIDERQNVLRTYALVATTLRESLKTLSRGRSPRVSRLRKALQAMSDASIGHEGLMAGMTRFPNLTGNVEFHLAAVASLVLLMGRRLQLPKKALIDLALAGVLHDLGRADLTEEQLAQSAEGQAAVLGQVPTNTAIKICAIELSPEMLNFAAVAFQHTQDLDKDPTFTARMIAVPCTFDLMTSPPPPRRGISPDQAVRIIQDKAGTRFDPNVVKLFVATVGLYPVGTTLELSGGEIAIVMEVPPDPAMYARPRVKVIRTPAGPADYILDLSQTQVEIKGAVDPIDEEVNVPHFLLA